MTDKKSEWKAEFKSIGFNNQAKIHGFNRYELLTYIELWIQQAKQQGFAEALDLMENKMNKLPKRGVLIGEKVKWSYFCTDLQAIIHKMRGEI